MKLLTCAVLTPHPKVDRKTSEVFSSVCQGRNGTVWLQGLEVLARGNFSRISENRKASAELLRYAVLWYKFLAQPKSLRVTAKVGSFVDMSSELLRFAVLTAVNLWPWNCIGQQSYGAFTKLPYVGVTPNWILMVWLVLIFVRIMCKMKSNDLSLSIFWFFKIK